MKKLRQRVAGWVSTQRNKLVAYVVQRALTHLRTSGEDVRMVYDNPPGSFSFQGNIKYLKKLPIPKRREQ